MTEINLFKPDSVIPECHPLDWDVVIKGRPYYVARFPGFVHTIGGRIGENCYWCWPRGERPCYDNLIEYDLDGPVEWGIVYDPRGYLSYSWGSFTASTAHYIIITRNRKPFYKFHGDIYEGIDRARGYITKINEHAINFNAIDYKSEIIGRKVWWRSEPAVVTDWCEGQACVILEPDGIEKFTTPAEFVEEDPDYYEEPFVKDDIFSPYIYWFRDEEG